MSKNPSSEEIAAALEVAIIACGVARDNSRARTKPPEYDTAANVLRAHLSRLREEAEFRTLILGSFEKWEAGERGRACELWDDALRAYRAIPARALEEPRDG